MTKAFTLLFKVVRVDTVFMGDRFSMKCGTITCEIEDCYPKLIMLFVALIYIYEKCVTCTHICFNQWLFSFSE